MGGGTINRQTDFPGFIQMMITVTTYITVMPKIKYFIIMLFFLLNGIGQGARNLNLTAKAHTVEKQIEEDNHE